MLRFFYFDLGRVLVDFDLDRMVRQVAVVAGIDPTRVLQVVFDGGLQRQHETGELTGRGFYEEFCRQTATRPDYDAMVRAACDIFWINAPIVPVVARLRAAGKRLGVLSNTSEIHWRYCFERFALLREMFGVYALSFELGAMKPDAAIFRAAAEMAGCAPEEIFFTDDIAGHVEGARAAGFDAVPFTSAGELADALRRRGVAFNY